MLLATITIFAGPKHVVVCTEAGWPNTMFGHMYGHMFGHFDADTFTGCGVPVLSMWIVAAALFLSPIVVIAVRQRSGR